MITTIGLDLDDTLYDRNHIYEIAYEQLQKDIGEVSTDFKVFNERFQAHSVGEYQRFFEGEISREAYRINRVKFAFADFGHAITDEHAEQFEAYYIENLDKITLREGVLELFAYLEERQLTVFLLSNGVVETQLRKLRALGVDELIDDDRIFISEGMGVSKPEEAIFKRVERQLGKSAQEIIYIGDDYINDYRGSIDAGWSGIWFKEKEQTFAALVSDLIESLEMQEAI